MPLKNFSQSTNPSASTQPETEKVVRLPLRKANLIIQDLKLFKNLQETTLIDSELIVELRERLAQEKALNASNEKTISLLKETIDMFQQKEKPSFAKFLRNTGKILIGVVVGIAGTVAVLVSM